MKNCEEWRKKLKKNKGAAKNPPCKSDNHNPPLLFSSPSHLPNSSPPVTPLSFFQEKRQNFHNPFIYLSIYPSTYQSFFLTAKGIFVLNIRDVLDGMAGDAAGSSIHNTVSSSGSFIFTNYPLIVAVVAFVIAQSSKLFIYWYCFLHFLNFWKIFNSLRFNKSLMFWDLCCVSWLLSLFPLSMTLLVICFFSQLGFQKNVN